jgi:hypothetical protein
MNDDQIKKLFGLARLETPPAPPGNFELRVLGAIRREERAAPLSWWDQLGLLFPRLALAAVLIMAACLAADYYSASNHDSTFAVDAAQVTAGDMFSANGGGS